MKATLFIRNVFPNSCALIKLTAINMEKKSKLIIRRKRNPASGFAARSSQCEREVRSVLEMLSRFLQIVRGTGIPDVSEKNVILLSSGKTQTDCVCR
ncbi:hypothetical protein CDAR_485591 [Caerostris darwini]|uniref:Uncharacterized protein n=1 Tax=Caerostris darwini TaxID=1538125 RepID=A0AAV4QVR9_9ARAC|nr:hypothetical protein CDAR_485591 [Caerostris darwini]